MSDYGTIAGVAKYVKHLTSGGTFTTSTKPTLAEVGEMLDESCAILNGWLAESGYVVPVTAARALAALSRYANLGAAGLAELTQRSGGYSETDENRRENKFLAEFYKAEDFIAKDIPGALGAESNALPAILSGFSAGGRTAGRQVLKPIFTRTSFGNNPTAESGIAEPDY